MPALAGAWRQAAARAADPGEGMRVLRGLRRQELLRIACADLLGRLDVVRVGQALTDVAVATLMAKYMGVPLEIVPVTSQNRTMTVFSFQPASSKWWWIGAMLNTRRRTVL